MTERDEEEALSKIFLRKTQLSGKPEKKFQRKRALPVKVRPTRLSLSMNKHEGSLTWRLVHSAKRRS